MTNEPVTKELRLDLAFFRKLYRRWSEDEETNREILKVCGIGIFAIEETLYEKGYKT